MSVETWADRAEHRGSRTEPMACPCCGRTKAADMIVRVGPALAALDDATRSECRRLLRVAEDPEYACTACLSTLHRTRSSTTRGALLTRQQMPGRR